MAHASFTDLIYLPKKGSKSKIEKFLAQRVYKLGCLNSFIPFEDTMLSLASFKSWIYKCCLLLPTEVQGL